VQDGTRRPTESTVKRARGRSEAQAERAREGRAQASTGQEAFSRSISIRRQAGRESGPVERQEEEEDQIGVDRGKEGRGGGKVGRG
jgi:hypothetical protein